MRNLMFRIVKGGARREELYDRLYSLGWGETTTNNYGFAPAEGHAPERFQMQLYTELLHLLDGSRATARIVHVLEVSCGRGGGLGHLAQPPAAPRRRWSAWISPRTRSHSARNTMRKWPTWPLCAAMHSHLPFEGASFDLVVNVEASHAYGDDPAFLREIRRVLHS